MPTKIGLVSDIHATPAPLKEALAIFRGEGVASILCPGDIAGYGDELDESVQLLIDNHCQTILGNHEIWQLEDAAEGEASQTLAFFRTLPSMLDLVIEGKRLYMAHASPPQSYKEGIRLLDENGEIVPLQKASWAGRLAAFDYDVLVVGHTHQMFAEKLGQTLIINPGSTVFNHSCAILSLPEMAIQWFPLSGKTPVKVWNWGGQINAC